MGRGTCLGYLAPPGKSSNSQTKGWWEIRVATNGAARCPESHTGCERWEWWPWHGMVSLSHTGCERWQYWPKAWHGVSSQLKSRGCSSIWFLQQKFVKDIKSKRKNRSKVKNKKNWFVLASIKNYHLKTLVFRGKRQEVF